MWMRVFDYVKGVFMYDMGYIIKWDIYKIKTKKFNKINATVMNKLAKEKFTFLQNFKCIN